MSPLTLGQTQWGSTGQLISFMLAMVGLSFAGQLAAHALSFGKSNHPTRKALGYLFPLAAGVFMAILWGRAQMALALTTGAAVACLLVAGGVCLTIAPVRAFHPRQAGLVRFVLPVALLLMISGFSGHFGWLHVAAFAIEGLAIYAAFGRRSPDTDCAPSPPVDPPIPHHGPGLTHSLASAQVSTSSMTISKFAPPDDDPPIPEPTSLVPDPAHPQAAAQKGDITDFLSRPTEKISDVPITAQSRGSRPFTPMGRRVALAFAFLLSMACAALMMFTIMLPSSILNRVPQETLGATVLAPILLLSCIGGATTAAQHKQGEEAFLQVVSFVLLTLCLLLPATIALWRFQPALSAYLMPTPVPAMVTTGLGEPTAASTQPETGSTDDGEITPPASEPASGATIQMNPPVRYPAISWRLDSAILVTIGLLLLGVSIGRLPLTQRTGMLLLIGYLLYMITYARGTL